MKILIKFLLLCSLCGNLAYSQSCIDSLLNLSQFNNTEKRTKNEFRMKVYYLGFGKSILTYSQKNQLSKLGGVSKSSLTTHIAIRDQCTSKTHYLSIYNINFKLLRELKIGSKVEIIYGLYHIRHHDGLIKPTMLIYKVVKINKF